MDTGKKKMLDGSLPSPQMKKLQTLSIRKLFSHYLPRMVLQYSQSLKSHCSFLCWCLLPLVAILDAHLSFCHKSNFDSLSFCMWKKDSRQGSSNKYQKTFWALYVICKSRWYTPNSFDKTKIIWPFLLLSFHVNTSRAITFDLHISRLSVFYGLCMPTLSAHSNSFIALRTHFPQPKSSICKAQHELDVCSTPKSNFMDLSSTLLQKET